MSMNFIVLLKEMMYKTPMAKENTENKPTSVRLPDDLKAELEAIGMAEERSLSNIIIRFCREGASRYRQQQHVKKD